MEEPLSAAQRDVNIFLNAIRARVEHASPDWVTIARMAGQLQRQAKKLADREKDTGKENEGK